MCILGIGTQQQLGAELADNNFLTDESAQKEEGID
jgi:hypothetical protein